MSIILIAFSFNNQKPKNKINSFLDVVNSYDSVAVNEFCYAIRTEDQSMEVCEKLKPFIDFDKDDVLVTQVTNLESCYGWGYLRPPKRSWFDR